MFNEEGKSFCESQGFRCCKAADRVYMAPTLGMSSKIVASFHSALLFFFPNGLESRGNFKFCFVGSGPASLFDGLTAQIMSFFSHWGHPCGDPTHLCLNIQLLSLSASRAMAPLQAFQKPGLCA